MSDKQEADGREPVWRYRMDGANGIESRLFGDVGDVPAGEGWQDSPAKCIPPRPRETETRVGGSETIKSPARRKRGG